MSGTGLRKGGGALVSEGDQPCWCLPEATGVEIERTQMFLEVDVEPLAFRGAGFFGCESDKRGANPSRPKMPGDHRVQNEGVCSAVPGNVDESDQIAVLPRADPTKAVVLKPCSPVGLSDRGAESVGVQSVEGCVFDVAPPFIRDRHVQILVRGAYLARIGHWAIASPLPDEVESGTAEHLVALEYLDPVDTAFADARTRARAGR